MIEWTKLKIPKTETIIRQYYTECHTELTHITTQTINQNKYTIYKVNKDGTTAKIRTTEDRPDSLEKYMEK